MDVSVVDTLAYSCRFLRVLKLSDFRVEDPQCLLALCGKVILPNTETSKEVVAQDTTDIHTIETCDNEVPEKDQLMDGEERRECICGNAVVPDIPAFQRLKSTTDSLSHNNVVFLHNRLSSRFHDQPAPYGQECSNDAGFSVATVGSGCNTQNPSPMDHQDVSTLMEQLLSVESSSDGQAMDVVCLNHDRNESAASDIDDETEDRVPVGQNNYDVNGQVSHHLPWCPQYLQSASLLAGPIVPTREEHENQLARRGKVDEEINNVEADGSESTKSNEGDSLEDWYENDDVVVLPLNVEDHSSEFGCLELETLWLDNVNLNDQVCAVLLQSLTHLRDLNLSDTDICNPWRLIDASKSRHLRLLQNLDVKSTALSRTALEMIPKFHPDLHKFSISSTTLPPHTYANIGKLTGVANLELIGGQFYPCSPEEIFEKGIAPAVHAIGIHLHSLNLEYIAHVNFEVIALSCPTIEHLDLRFACITVGYPCVSLGDCCPHLISLNLGFSHIDAKEGEGDNAHPVAAEKALEKMLGQPRLLEELDLSGLTITDETVKNIFPVTVHPLAIISLSRCQKVTIAGVQHIWEQCPHLKSIDITHCREVTLADFQNFKKSCHQSRPVFKQDGKLDWI